MGFLDGLKQFGSTLAHRIAGVAAGGANEVGALEQGAARDVFIGATAVGHALGLGVAPSTDQAYDGMLVGAHQQTFVPGTPLSSIPAATPFNGVRNGETLLYVNGVGDDVAAQETSMQCAANATGSRVIGIHNATQGLASDALETVGDIGGVGQDKAVDTIASTVYGELSAGRGVHLMAHSEGAAETSRALTQVYQRFVSDGLSPSEAEAKLHAVKVETFAGAAADWPNGPQYVDYINTVDPVPQLLGVGQDEGALAARAGKGAVIESFTDLPWNNVRDVHDFNTVYLQHRKPFDQVYPAGTQT